MWTRHPIGFSRKIYLLREDSHGKFFLLFGISGVVATDSMAHAWEWICLPQLRQGLFQGFPSLEKVILLQASHLVEVMQPTSSDQNGGLTVRHFSDFVTVDLSLCPIYFLPIFHRCCSLINIWWAKSLLHGLIALFPTGHVF